MQIGNDRAIGPEPLGLGRDLLWVHGRAEDSAALEAVWEDVPLILPAFAADSPPGLNQLHLQYAQMLECTAVQRSGLAIVRPS